MTKKLQLKLLDGRDEPLQSIINTCKVYETANANKSILDGRAPLSVNMIANQQSNQQSNQQITQQNDTQVNTIQRSCFNCGYAFTFGHRNECKAKDINCSLCGKKGQFNKFGRSRGKKTNVKTEQQSKQSEVKLISWEQGNKEINDNNIKVNNCGNFFRINSNNGTNNKKWMKKYRVNGKIIEFKLDTGADVNCIPIDLIEKNGKNNVNINNGINEMKFENGLNNFPVYDYNRNRIKIFGKVNLNYDISDNSEQSAQFFVVDNEFEPIIGLDTCIAFGLIKRLDVNLLSKLPSSKDEFVKQFHDIFNGLGKFPGPCSIQLHDDAVPALHCLVYWID